MFPERGCDDYLLVKLISKNVCEERSLFTFNVAVAEMIAGSDLRVLVQSRNQTLRQILQRGFSAVTIANVHRWVNGIADPVGNAILDGRDGLEKLDPDAAAEFIQLYLERRISEGEE